MKKTSKNEIGPEPPSTDARTPAPRTRSAAELLAAGKGLRGKVLRQAQGVWKRPADRADPLAILRASDASRLAHLLPIRYGRMLQTPFTFYRGAAAVMAADLAKTPATGIRVQACGDCHLLNFGGFATPERNILFDINDFDETLPAPWEWDVKRLVASFVLAAGSNGLPDSDGRDAAVTCAQSYREHMREYSEMSPLEVWYASIDSEDMLGLAPNARGKASLRQRIAKATKQSGSEVDYPQLAGMVGGRIRIQDNPPLIFHPEEAEAKDFQTLLEENHALYRESLADDRRILLDRYRVVDGAMKVVGIGSVGTRCAIILMMSVSNEPLFLQWKEANNSVLEPYAGKSAYSHHGQRVVMGQRLMQPATDTFLGWLTGRKGHHGYVRQLRDAKIKPLVETFDAEILSQYAKACGWALARAHAKAGDALTISGYLGTKDPFDEAMGDFALAYADQTERDHAALKAAVRAGKVEVHIE
ncbi:MAG: DUF2252 domain-containing protein [Gammaproteobacteria bacterium]